MAARTARHDTPRDGGGIPVHYRGLPDPAMAELMDLYHLHGALRPQLVVEFAADPSTALHTLFEWDDEAAAAAHRLSQARGIIRNVRVHIEAAPEQHIRAFVSLGTESGREYKMIADVIKSPLLVEQIRRQFKRDITAWQQRLAGFDEFREVLDQLNGLAAAV